MTWLASGRVVLSRWLAAALVGLVNLVLVVPNALAGPGELTVVGMGPFKEALADALARYQAETGETIAVSYVSRGQLKAKVHGADHPDLVIASQDAMEALEKDGQTQVGTRAALGRVGLAVAMRQGAQMPDLSTAAALTRALLSAKSLGYADPQESPAGQQAGALVERLGLTEALKARTQYGSGSNPVAPVGFGDVEIGLHPTNLILLAKGVQLAAPVPAELQQWTRYDAALISGAPNQNEARRLLAYLRGSAAMASFASRGFEPVP